MNASKMKNMVIIKDLPSNIVEEAYVVLKPYVKFNKKNENTGETKKDMLPGYIVKEAEMVISNYLSDLENTKKLRNLEVEKIQKRYDKLKKLFLGLCMFFILNVIIQLCL